MKPAVYAIGTPLTEFKIVRLPGFEPTSIPIHYAGKVIRMDMLEVGQIFPFFNRRAEIFQGVAGHQGRMVSLPRHTSSAGYVRDGALIGHPGSTPRSLSILFLVC